MNPLSLDDTFVRAALAHSYPYRERRYRLWHAIPSHGQVLIRSPRGAANDPDVQSAVNDDHLFTGVEHISAPTSVMGLLVRAATDAEATQVELNDRATLYVLGGFDSAGEIMLGTIVAAGYKREFTTYEFFESALLSGPSPIG